MAYQDGYTAAAEGLTRGASIALSVDQVRRQRAQQQWENDYRTLAAGIQLASTKGMSKESSAKILNGTVKPIWEKMNPGSEFPTLTPQTVDNFMPVVQNLNKLATEANKTGKWDVAFTEANNQVANYMAQTAAMEDVSAKEKAGLEAAMAPLKAGMESQQKAKEAAAKGNEPLGNAEILKQMTEVQAKIATLDRPDQWGNADPNRIRELRAQAVKQLDFLNSQLTEPSLRRTKITDKEAQILREQGFSDDQIAQKYYAVPELSITTEGPAPQPELPIAQPAAKPTAPPPMAKPPTQAAVPAPSPAPAPLPVRGFAGLAAPPPVPATAMSLAPQQVKAINPEQERDLLMRQLSRKQPGVIKAY